MVINQGDVFWIDFADPIDSEPGYTRPGVVIQNNLLNHTNIRTVLVCVVTSNVKRANVPGNVSLESGEGNLPKRSVVIVSQVLTVSKSQLRDYVGTLSKRRIRQILDGLRLITEPRESPR